MEDKILNARKEAGLTQEALAKKVGVSSSTISSWETGKSEPNEKEIQKLNKILNIDLETKEISANAKDILKIVYIILLIITPGIYLINQMNISIKSYNVMILIGEDISKVMLEDYGNGIIKALVIMFGWYAIANIANYVFYQLKQKLALSITLVVETLIFAISIVSISSFDIYLSLLCLVPVITGFFQYLFLKN